MSERTPPEADDDRPARNREQVFAVRLPDTDEAPSYHRDRYLALAPGRAREVDPDIGDILLDRYPYLDRACGTIMTDGAVCPRPYGDCRFHDADSETETEPAESDPDSDSYFETDDTGTDDDRP